MNATALDAVVRAVNNAHEFANKLHPQLTAIFAPFVGMAVTKNDGTLLAKIKKLMPPFPFSPTLCVYKLPSDYSLVYVVKTCEEHGGHAHYYETSVYVGELKDNTLEKLVPAENRRSDYTAFEVLYKQDAAKGAKKIYDDARSNCFPFNENRYH